MHVEWTLTRGLSVLGGQALMEALESGHVGGAGLDVHWVEPADPSDPIYAHPHVIALPHTGICTVDIVDAYAEMIVDNIVRLREGRELVQRLL
jgi:phosphoglycerate dehydrogenase-like enzyme